MFALMALFGLVVFAVVSIQSNWLGSPAEPRALARALPVPANGAARRSNQATATAIALRSACGDERPVASSCRNFASSPPLRATSVRNRQPKPWQTTMDFGAAMGSAKASK